MGLPSRCIHRSRCSHMKFFFLIIRCINTTVMWGWGGSIRKEFFGGESCLSHSFSTLWSWRMSLRFFSEARLCLTGFDVIPITISLLLESKLFGNSFALSLWFFSYILLESTSHRSLWEALGYQMNRGLDGCQTWKMSPNRITLVVKSSFRRNLSR